MDTSCIMASCRSCRGVEVQTPLTNPSKHKENGRYNSLLKKFIVDDNIEDLEEMLINILFSSEE